MAFSAREFRSVTFSGLVQGVGFRPTVANLANDLGVSGWVRNAGGAAECALAGSGDALNALIGEIQARFAILDMRVSPIPPFSAEGFSIAESGEVGAGALALIPPDAPTCESCLAELRDPKNRRYMHPFISCAACGPRYTILKRLPYDRDATAMDAFPMCASCAPEYKSPRDRRFHAQTIACHACGPRLEYRPGGEAPGGAAPGTPAKGPCPLESHTENDYFPCPAASHGILKGEAPGGAAPGTPAKGKLSPWNSMLGTGTTVPPAKESHAGNEYVPYPAAPHGILKGEALEQEREGGALAVSFAARDILAGGIVAIKGIGGFHLACLPEQAPVERLRAIKGREGKPFAVMFGALLDIEQVCDVSDAARALLTGFARPIVLLNAKGKAFSENVTRGSLDIGCFLPYAPVHHLLFDALSESGVRALVMTSANVSGEPIIFDSEGLSRFQPGDLAGILDHDRAILNPVDDSVARVIDGGAQILRRARGYAPLPIRLEGARGEAFCAGGDLKAAFSYVKSGYAYVGPHVGDLGDAGCLCRYALLSENMKLLLNAHPEIAARDLHPRYLSAAHAGELGLPTKEVQHHHAHIASAMAEHGLTRAIGVAFDGTGFGADGAIWGGEFLLCEGGAFRRTGHLLPLAVVGGDRIARDANRLSAFYLDASGIDPARADWAVLKKARDLRVNCATETSMGRLFDAASAILGICGENEYEGECAILLEREAALARRAGIAPAGLAFDLAQSGDSFVADFRSVVRALARGGDVPALALGFHAAVADLVARACERMRAASGLSDVALSGGVFQNRLLTELCLAALRAHGFRVFINRQVPPGDGGISLGQAYIVAR